MTNRMTAPTLFQPFTYGAALVGALLSTVADAVATVRLWRRHAADARCIAQMDDHLRRDAGLSPAPARPPRFPMV
jgi:uncharacterized protein YjiS (DUF1127 family)